MTRQRPGLLRNLSGNRDAVESIPCRGLRQRLLPNLALRQRLFPRLALRQRFIPHLVLPQRLPTRRIPLRRLRPDPVGPHPPLLQFESAFAIQSHQAQTVASTEALTLWDPHRPRTPSPWFGN